MQILKDSEPFRIQICNKIFNNVEHTLYSRILKPFWIWIHKKIRNIFGFYVWPNLSLVINPTNCNYVSLSYQYYNKCYFYFKVALMKMLLLNKISLCRVSSGHRKAIKRCHMWQSYKIDEPNIFLISETSVYWNYIQNYRIYLPNENLNSKVIKNIHVFF